jgi:aspartate carbamoyltransferase catalytic subunit
MKRFPSILESTRDLSKDQIDILLSKAKSLKTGQNPGFFFNQNPPILTTLFLENSTRTKTSFAVAMLKLGGHFLDFNVETSSLKKGESLEETLHTIKHQGINLLVLRTPTSHELSPFRENPPLKIINGGDGINQHPTQGLLDLFTLFDLGINPQGKTMAVIGDIIHSRVFNSLSDLFLRFGGKIIVCGPEEWLPRSLPEGVESTSSLDSALKKADIIYTLRIQKERHSEQSSYDQSYPEVFGINLEKLKNPVPVFHPGPVNIGVELSLDVLRSRHYQGYRQVQNSIFMRMAVILAMLENEKGN